MSNIISLTASKRDFLGTGASRRLRHEGMIPAVIYARGAENVNFQISLQQVEKIEHHAGLVSIDIEGIGVKNAIVKEVQYKAINSMPLAVDFLEVKADQKVLVSVPVEAKGEPEGFRAGGQLEQVIHELEIEVAPADIPEVIIVDVSALKVDENLTIADVKLPGSAVAKGEPGQIVFQVRIPHSKGGDAAEAAPAAAEAAAPEKK